MAFLLKVMADGINFYLFHVKWEVLLTRINDESNFTNYDMEIVVVRLWYFTPLSAIFQLYGGVWRMYIL
jgi:hypothetical protein